jgi:catechol 2,3-dioxygenase-like lactoylglutathione lyase family enzyme
MPLGHLGVNVPDLAAARAYYDALMPLLEYEPFLDRESEFSYRPAGGKVGTYVFFYGALEDGLHTRHRPGLQHLAFMVRTRAAVHRVYDWARERGCEIVHPPQEFPQYHPGYYAVFWLDPHGFMLEAVCHRDEDAQPS